VRSRTVLLALQFLVVSAVAGAESPRRAHSPVPRARYLIRIGEFVPTTGAALRGLATMARESLRRNLSRASFVVLSDTEGVPAPEHRPRLIGYTIDGRIRVVEGPGATRVEVSLLVQTLPGREYRFESAASLTLVGDLGQQAIEEATGRAVGSATARCLAALAGQ